MGVQPCPDSVSPAPQTPWVLATSSHTFSFTFHSLIQLFDHLFTIPSSPGFVCSLVLALRTRNWQDTATALTI